MARHSIGARQLAPPHPAAAGILPCVFKALVCIVLFFIAVGAIGMWFATQRRGRD